MNVFIVHAHPEPKSFNGALTEVAAESLRGAGHEVVVSDLYAMRFHAVSDRGNFTTVVDPDYFKPQAEESHATDHDGFAPDVEAELRKLEACDLLIFQFPLWWFGLPAILKGWVDRVFARGRVYGRGHSYETGRFVGRRAVLSLTTGGPAPAYEADGDNGDISVILKPIHRGMFNFVGFDVLSPQLSYGPARVTDEDRRAMLEAWRRRVAELFDEEPIEVGRY
ncbi:MAG: NAD(P)H-dependent oxidoreductase [Alphaproteobacteria bacterium]|jgi:NAD(P)H dehydrogenase (quinone)|nr:NAD(P)H-dependent oxidoreductase [Alphaproteobacteria bacterium]